MQVNVVWIIELSKKCDKLQIVNKDRAQPHVRNGVLEWRDLREVDMITKALFYVAVRQRLN